MRLRKASLALATCIAGLVGASAFDSATAGDHGYKERSRREALSGPGGTIDLRAPQPSQSESGATSRPFNSSGEGSRGLWRINENAKTPSHPPGSSFRIYGVPQGGPGLRSGVGGGRMMNGGTGQR